MTDTVAPDDAASPPGTGSAPEAGERRDATEADTAQPEAPTAGAPPPSAGATPPEPAAPRTVGRAVVDRLAAAGARFAFTVPGESFLGLLDGMDEAGIRTIATRHEGAAAFMAAAASRLTGKPQLCLGTRAVGAANLAVGIHTARADSVPVVALVGQVRRAHRGRDAFQEADLAGSIGRLAKWAAEIDDPNSALSAVDEALARATEGRPGPVLLSFPEDVLDAQAPTGRTGPQRPPPAGPQTGPPAPEDVRAALHLLAASERGVILAGGGVLAANAGRRLLRLADALGIPVVAAWRRPDVVPNGHPLYLGMTGYAAAPTVLPRLLEADVVLVLGCRLSEVASFGYRIPARASRWIHVDLEPRRAGSTPPEPTLAMESDAGRFIDAALSTLRGGAIHAQARQGRLERAEADRRAFLDARIVDATPWDGPGVHPGRVITELGRALPPEAVITTDAGNFGGWAARGYRFRRSGTFLGPTSGAMGYGLPAAIAASLVLPRRPVVALAGDGGFAMTMVELETAVREGVAPVSIVFDNRRYGTIAMHQQREGRALAATELGPIDFAAAARALGGVGFTVERDDQFPDALREALASERPAVIHLMVDRRWVSVDEPAAAG